MSRQHPTRHLTEEEFADYLLGLPTAAARAHLLACTHCRDEMESFGASLTAFNRASLTWSREQAAAHPVRIEKQAASSRRSMLRPGWQKSWAGFAAAAVLAFAVALPVALVHEHAARTGIASSQAAMQSAAQPQDAEIAEDNRMMAAIDAEISQPVVSPIESFATFQPQQEPQHTSVDAGRVQ